MNTFKMCGVSEQNSWSWKEYQAKQLQVNKFNVQQNDYMTSFNIISN